MRIFGFHMSKKVKCEGDTIFFNVKIKSLTTSKLFVLIVLKDDDQDANVTSQVFVGVCRAPSLQFAIHIIRYFVCLVMWWGWLNDDIGGGWYYYYYLTTETKSYSIVFPTPTQKKNKYCDFSKTQDIY